MGGVPFMVNKGKFVGVLSHEEGREGEEIGKSVNVRAPAFSAWVVERLEVFLELTTLGLSVQALGCKHMF